MGYKIAGHFQGVERGYLSIDRPVLDEVSEQAAKKGIPIVTSELPRFARSEAYDQRLNPVARLTTEEFGLLHKRTGDAQLETIADPNLSERELHALRVKRTGRCGRPRELSPDQEQAIVHQLGWYVMGRWTVPISRVARLYRVSQDVIKRLLTRPDPELGGLCWQEVRTRELEDVFNDGHCYG
jgi:hypothetical protein